ncbi:hypothetical protein MLD38_003224 [Melastoma candidum]|uniref:Uncharacterized protein n=1 Tax=Melastoma candidum TaxID=119954 RepID=A0ACB9S213_9MYRT|nr:hypothetical protein MLD38_003224 [Melastoma candidum]
MDCGSKTGSYPDSPSSSHLAIDIGGSLIKLVYCSRGGGESAADENCCSSTQSARISNGISFHSLQGGKLRFEMFETSKVADCMEFIRSKKTDFGGGWHLEGSKEKNVIKATGGGAYKFTDPFKEQLDIVLDKQDEMDRLVAGANFLLKAVHHEGFT